MRQVKKGYGFILLLSGIAVIIAGFFLLVSKDKRNDVFWLDLAVACFVFIVNSVTEFGIINTHSDYDKQIARLGIRLLYIRIYSIIAIALIATGYFVPLKFNLQLFLQLAAAFILIIGYFLSHLSSVQTAKVLSEQRQLRKGKDDIINELNQFERFIARDASRFGAENQRLQTIKEAVRYLSPTNDLSANVLDDEIKQMIQQAHAAAKGDVDSQAEIFLLLNKCEDLLKLRKNHYSH